MDDIILKVEGLSKSFSSTTAVADVYKPADSAEAANTGISMITQEMGTIGGMTIAENIFLGREFLFTGNSGLVSTWKMNREAAAIFRKTGISHIDPRKPVTSLSFEDRKIVEIARAVYTNPSLLIIDETTTALSQSGRSILYSIMEQMKKDGRTVIFISHDLEEVRKHCDFISVMRDGHYIDTLEDKTLRTYSGMAFVDVTDILQFFRSGSREQLYYSVKGLTVQLKKLRNTEALFMCSSQLYAGIAEYIREHPPLQSSLLKDSAVQEAFYSVSGVFDFFLKIMTACISQITGNDEKKYSQATRKSIEYIRENYSDKSLGIRPIAENVGLSANRLMFVFKQDTGYTLSSYLTRYRVEKGKEFLQEKSFKIYEIADRTGFSSSQYFSQVFYRITGKTPLDWRDRK